jgi:hypothetical protein
LQDNPLDFLGSRRDDYDAAYWALTGCALTGGALTGPNRSKSGPHVISIALNCLQSVYGTHKIVGV